MKIFALAALLLAGLSAPAFSCEVTAGPGAAIRLSEGKSGGVATIGCIFGDKWELRAYYFGEQRIYNEQLVVADYGAIGASKLWTFRDGRRFRPFLGVGLMLKEAQRCHYDGQEVCNRLTPLPFCFLASAGLHMGDVLISFNHCSNASMDYGPEKKNLGQDFFLAQVRF